jgi:CRP-like cAMP-binding protein
MEEDNKNIHLTN